MANLPGPKEAMLNGLPMSEVQRRERRGQIIDYGSRALSPRSAAMVAPSTGSRDIVHSSAQAARNWTDHSPKPARQNSGKQTGLPGMDSPKRQPLLRYRDFIDSALAKTPWIKNRQINALPMIFILGIGIWLPVRLFFGFLAMLFSATPAVSGVFSVLGTILATGAVLYFVVRRISGKGIV
jgi:hypothetical protein